VQRDKAEQERDAAQRWRDVAVATARGVATFACSGAAILSPHYEYSVGTMLPALVAVAVNLRDVARTALVLGCFVIVLLGMAVMQAYMRTADRTRRPLRSSCHLWAVASLLLSKLHDVL